MVAVVAHVFANAAAPSMVLLLLWGSHYDFITICRNEPSFWTIEMQLNNYIAILLLLIIVFRRWGVIYEMDSFIIQDHFSGSLSLQLAVRCSSCIVRPHIMPWSPMW